MRLGSRTFPSEARRPAGPRPDRAGLPRARVAARTRTRGAAPTRTRDRASSSSPGRHRSRLGGHAPPCGDADAPRAVPRHALPDWKDGTWADASHPPGNHFCRPRGNARVLSSPAHVLGSRERGGPARAGRATRARGDETPDRRKRSKTRERRSRVWHLHTSAVTVARNLLSVDRPPVRFGSAKGLSQPARVFTSTRTESPDLSCATEPTPP